MKASRCLNLNSFIKRERVLRKPIYHESQERGR
nr:MAG TPA: hypothetical protein [Caudoviricetes sp.]